MKKKILFSAILAMTPFFSFGCCSKKSIIEKSEVQEDPRAIGVLNISLPSADESPVEMNGPEIFREENLKYYADDEKRQTTHATDPLRDIPRVIDWDRGFPQIPYVVDAPECAPNVRGQQSAVAEKSKKMVQFFSYISPALQKVKTQDLYCCFDGQTIKQENSFFWQHNAPNSCGVQRAFDTYRLNCLGCGYLEYFLVIPIDEKKFERCKRDVCKRVIQERIPNVAKHAINDNDIGAITHDKLRKEKQALTCPGLLTECSTCKDKELWILATAARETFKKQNNAVLEGDRRDVNYVSGGRAGPLYAVSNKRNFKKGNKK